MIIIGKSVNLTGRRYGRLVVIQRTDRKDGTSWIWECLCDCGATSFVKTGSLNAGYVKSCGCLRLEKSVKNLSGDPKDKLGQVDNTNLSRIASKKLPINNTSGHVGVYRDSRSGSWVSYIYFKKVRHHLGTFKDKGDAIAARKIAEKNLFEDILNKHKHGGTENGWIVQRG